MDLLDRYLNHVRFWLPRRQQEDILAELSEDLRSEIQESESALGRSLTEAETAELLKRRGDPMRVAAGFLPQECLIGPALFPLYRFVLKILAWCFVVPWILVWVGLVALWPGYRAAHPGWALFETWQSFLSMGIFLFGLTTVVFAIVERNGTAERWRRDWDPRRLPAKRDPRRIPRSSSVAEIVFGILFLLVWVQLPHVPALGGESAPIGPGPIWPTVYWLVLALIVGTLAMAGANLLRPWWTPVRAALQLALNLAGLVPLALLIRVESWVHVASTRLTPERVAAVTRSLDVSLRGMFLLIGLFVVIACVQDVVRLVRLRRARVAA